MFSLRLAQLDVARQKESLPFIKEFISMLAEAGYNGLMLYLEDRIKTKSYQLSPDSDSYSEAEIRELVKFAEDKNMELIPCVATLGHAERFLRHPELEKFSELRGGRKGRFGKHNLNTFCISAPGFYDFLGEYLLEVAALFPSSYFHIGLDEFWEFALCDECSKKMPTVAAEEEHFLGHILKVRQILSTAGKRCAMWSDMFEIYSSIVPRVPSDVIMMDWQYQTDVRTYLHHLFDGCVEDRFASNKKYGFDTIIAPNDMRLSTPNSFIEYAEGKNSLGCIITSWEKSDTFLHRTLPVFIFSGYRMSGMSDGDAFEAMMRQLFGVTDPVFSAAVRMAVAHGFRRHFESFSTNWLFKRSFFGLPYPAMDTAQGLYNQIEALQGMVTKEIGRRVCHDILAALEEKILGDRLKKAYHQILDQRNQENALAEIATLTKDTEKWFEARQLSWQEWRPGITPCVFTAAKPKILAALNEHRTALTKGDFVNLRICQPDGYVVEQLLIEVCVDGQWLEVTRGSFKPERTDEALSEHFIPLQYDGDISAVRLTATGMGGAGIAWIEIIQQGRKYVPAEILKLTGKVSEPEYLLENNIKFSWFGCQSTRRAYFDASIAGAENSVELKMTLS